MTIEEKMEGFDRINAVVDLLMAAIKQSNESVDIQYLAVLMLQEGMKTTLLSMGINPEEI
jgi:hypothetical protein